MTRPIARNPSLGNGRSGFASQTIGSRQYWGTLLGGGLARPIGGREPLAGEAVVGERAAVALGLAGAAGTIDDERTGLLPVVARADLRPPIDDLAAYALIRGDPKAGPVTEIVVLMRSSADVDMFVETAPALLGAQSPVGIARAAELLDVREGLVQEVGDLNDEILVGSLSSGGLLVAAIMFGAIEQRKREFGLRRSQGATRATIAALVLIESLGLATAGVLAGGLAGSAVVLSRPGCCRTRR